VSSCAAGCGAEINFGATYCSHRCQVAHTGKRSSRLIFSEEEPPSVTDAPGKAPGASSP
jgi:hypothetical protein